MDTKREDRLCQVSHSSQDVEDEHFLFSCPAYSDVTRKYSILFQQAFSVSDFLSTLSQTHVVVFSESVFHVGNLLYPLTYDSVLFYVLYFVCWPLLVPRTLKHKSKSKSNRHYCTVTPRY